MDPVVYDFTINNRGTRRSCARAKTRSCRNATMLQVPNLPGEPHGRPVPAPGRTSTAARTQDRDTLLRTLVGNLFRVADPASGSERADWDKAAEAIKAANGFDPIQHEQIREDLRLGRIGLARNRLPADTDIQDVRDEDVLLHRENSPWRAAGEAALREGRVAVLSLAAGVGSRWTTGAGVIKAVNPFIFMKGKHRSFLELHLAKTTAVATYFNSVLPHLFPSFYHGPIESIWP